MLPGAVGIPVKMRPSERLSKARYVATDFEHRERVTTGDRVYETSVTQQAGVASVSNIEEFPAFAIREGLPSAASILDSLHCSTDEEIFARSTPNGTCEGHSSGP